MTAAARVGDLTTGHTIGSCFYPPVSCPVGSPNVEINGMGVVRVGDAFNPHGGGSCGTHSGTVIVGSSTVLINGMGCARVGDPLSDGDSIAMGSPNVLVGG